MKLAWIFGIILSLVFADSLYEKVEKGNQLLQENQLEEALRCYNEALVDAPESAIIKFNIGNGVISTHKLIIIKTFYTPDKTEHIENSMI